MSFIGYNDENNNAYTASPNDPMTEDETKNFMLIKITTYLFV